LMLVVEIEKKAVVILLQSRHLWPTSLTTNKAQFLTREREKEFFSEKIQLKRTAVTLSGKPRKQSLSEVVVL
jgi:hypothetical protein